MDAVQYQKKKKNLSEVRSCLYRP